MTAFSAQAQAAGNTNPNWAFYDWLKTPEQQQQNQSATTTTTGQDGKDAFSVLSTGALWQEKVASVYTHRVNDGLVLSYETSSTLLTESSTAVLPLAGGMPDDLSRDQKASMQYKLADGLTLTGNLHQSTTETTASGGTPLTSGGGLSAEGHLPLNSVFTFDLNSDRTASDDVTSNLVTTSTTCNAQFKQPLGSLPLSASLKGHYEELSTPGSPTGRMPTLEQSLIWKPAQDTTLQMGLRQQQYQEYPGIDNQFNEAVFADWSQKLVNDISWHSYAEVLNSRNLVDQAPASPIASGSNGTAQATPPSAATGSLTSALPIALEDQTFTFSTGPSIKIQKDLSASFEYSNRWDKSAAYGTIGQEQRVSVSVKGSF